MKKIIILLVLLMTSSLYAQTMLGFGFGGEYDFSIVSEYDTDPDTLINLFYSSETGKPAHSLSAGLKGEIGNMLSSGFTYGAEGSLTLGVSTKTFFNFAVHASPTIGYSFLTDDWLMQIYVHPVTLSLNPYYLEEKPLSNMNIVTQVLDLKTGLSFAFSELGLRNASANGYAIGANMKWGQMRFNSAQKGFVKDLGFGISFYLKRLDFIFGEN